jgi:hypothetical protein
MLFAVFTLLRMPILSKWVAIAAAVPSPKFLIAYDRGCYPVYGSFVD